ncbi:hypothetical protein Q4506_02265 [Colwellia sp. 4_MG-2023]|jgi:hypothetical protein|uniref:hypothetical protein n=1 Tax=unclassified Colwellia TaxID=196834 RepID=UPI001C098D06|nr:MULTISPECIES: hypothetical protein [unclassified Colwellia]MBU2923675.1 hypothetical protein [Colwellia sp. C2M11]MDO6486242.1 hypothetical protein [Colwellia sp. 6_MG-2023]MDO6505802.1 hypothetical protein [Colwellia sp. 5_MG-2023]MDO6554483.1 hypothetical protein [Colwellia sp. 4_MG-2023]MDO6652225.1 hypothetical protein [Colwellia sp. 3_MG-2023]
MNRHLKVAFMVAPFLSILGYIGADYYNESKAAVNKIIQLVPEGHCDVINHSCVLKSGEFKVNISDKDGITEVNSTFPLDSATLFLVDDAEQITPYLLGMKESPYYWKNETALRSFTANKGDSYKLRLIAKIKGGQYIAEFYTQTVK